MRVSRTRLARFVPRLTEADMARMIGLDPTDKRRRHDARRAFDQLSEDGVIDLRRDGRTFRLFGAPRFGEGPLCARHARTVRVSRADHRRVMRGPIRRYHPNLAGEDFASRNYPEPPGQGGSG